MNRQGNLYARARTVFGFRIKRVWFKLNPALERSQTTEETSGLYQPNSKFVVPRQSIVQSEDTDDEQRIPIHRELSIAAFWHYLYSNSWGQKCSLRILDGVLLDTMLRALFVLERDEAILVRTMHARTTNTRNKPVNYKTTGVDEETETIHETLLINFTYYGSDVGCDEASIYPDSGDTSSCCSICDTRSSDSEGSIKQLQRLHMPCPHGHHPRDRSPEHKKTGGNRLFSEMLSYGKKRNKKPKDLIDSENSPQVCCPTKDTSTTKPELNLDKFPYSQRTQSGVQDEPECARHDRSGEYYLHLNTQSKLAPRDRLLMRKKMKQDEQEARRNQLQKIKDHSFTMPSKVHITGEDVSAIGLDMQRFDHKDEQEAKRNQLQKIKDHSFTMHSKVHITREDVRAVGLVTQRFDHTPSLQSFINYSNTLNTNRKEADMLIKEFKYKLTSTNSSKSSSAKSSSAKSSSHECTRQFAEEVGGVTDSVAIRNAILNFQQHKAMSGPTYGTNLPKLPRRFVFHEEFRGVPGEGGAVRHRRRKAQDLPATGGALKKSLHHHEELGDGVKGSVYGSKTDMPLGVKGGVYGSKTDMPLGVKGDVYGSKTDMPLGVKGGVYGSKTDMPLSSIHRDTNKVAPMSMSMESLLEYLASSGKKKPLHFRNLNREYSSDRFLVGKREKNRSHLIGALKKHKKKEKKGDKRSKKDKRAKAESFPEVVELIHEEPPPEPMILGKLRPFRFQEHRNYQTSIHDMEISDFKSCDNGEFICNLLHALGNFVVRKEDVTTSCGMETLTTVTFTRPEVFRPIVH